MKWIDIKARLKKYPVKAVIFRPGLPTITDYARRKDNERYMLLAEKKVIPSPPGNKYIHFFEGRFWIFLVSPRIGTYYYITTPDINFDPETQTVNIKYLTRVKGSDGKLVESEFSDEEIGINLTDKTVTNKTIITRINEIKNEKESLINNKNKLAKSKDRANKVISDDNKNLMKNYEEQINKLEKRISFLDNYLKEMNTDKSNNQTIETNFEMIDHDDLNWLAGETQKAESKYTPKEGWWDKHGKTLMDVTFMIVVAIAIYIMYQQVISPAALANNPGPLTVLCNMTGIGSVI